MAGVFSRLEDHEEVVFAEDRRSGLRCIVAIHSTQLGPALGGTRFRAYRSEDEALEDVLRLSRAMTYKNACAGIDAGGGKAVIIGDPRSLGSESLFRAYGRLLEGLSGRYVTACDVGTGPRDMAMIARETRWVTGSDPVDGGSGDSGVLTAFGVFLAMRACTARVFGSDDLAGRHVAVQGLGKVGRRLVGHLVEFGARVSVADTSQEAVERVAGIEGVEVVDVDDVATLEADIFSPNALGGVLDEEVIPRIRAAIVCGGANNQLAEAADAQRLRDHGVLYAPDYVVNAGGVINVAQELHPLGYAEPRARRLVERIPDTLAAILDVAEHEGVDTEVAARRGAEQRIEEVGRLRRFWLP